MGDLIPATAAAYGDDVVVKTLEAHTLIDDLTKVFEKLNEF